MKEQIKRLAPVSVYDMKGMENWLQEFAAEGYRIEEIGSLFVHLIYKCPTSTPIRYRLMPAAQLFYRHMENNIIIPDSWEEISCPSRAAKIYVSYDEKADDLYPNDSVKSDIIQKICKTYNSFIYWFLLAFVVPALLLTFLDDFTKKPIIALVDLNLNAFFILLLPLCSMFSKQLSDKKIIKQQDVAWQISEIAYRPKMWLVLKSLVFTLTLLILSINAIFNSPTNQFAWFEKSPPSLPVIELSLLEGNQYDPSIFVRYKHTLFAPIQYKASQVTQTEYGEDSKQNDMYMPSLKTEYYRLIKPNLAEKLAEEFIRDASTVSTKHENLFGIEDMRELSSTGFDRVVLFKTNSVQQLIALKGNEVISLLYYGHGDLSLILDQLKEKMETAYDYKLKDVLHAQ